MSDIFMWIGIAFSAIVAFASLVFLARFLVDYAMTGNKAVMEYLEFREWRIRKRDKQEPPHAD